MSKLVWSFGIHFEGRLYIQKQKDNQMGGADAHFNCPDSRPDCSNNPTDNLNT